MKNLQKIMLIGIALFILSCHQGSFVPMISEENSILIDEVSQEKIDTSIDLFIDPNNSKFRMNKNTLDNRLIQNGIGQKLNITNQEKNDLIAFLKILSGQDVFDNEKWSDPFND